MPNTAVNALSTITGRSVSDIFPELVSLRQDASGLVITRWDASLGPQPTPAELAAAMSAAPTQTALLAYAADMRWRIETGSIMADGSRIDTSRDSQTMIAGAYAYVTTSGQSIAFKAASGWVTMSADAVRAVALAVGAHVQACFAAEQAVAASITAGTITTFAEIDAAAWPASAA